MEINLFCTHCKCFVKARFCQKPLRTFILLQPPLQVWDPALTKPKSKGGSNQTGEILVSVSATCKQSLVNTNLFLNHVKAITDLAHVFCNKRLLENTQNHQVSLGRQHGKLKTEFADRKKSSQQHSPWSQVHTGSEIPD